MDWSPRRNALKARMPLAWRAWKRPSRCANPAINAPIVLLEGVFNAEQLALAAHLALDVVVHEVEQLALLESGRGRASLRGLAEGRYGNEPAGLQGDQFESALARLEALPGTVREIRAVDAFRLRRRTWRRDDRPSRSTRFGQLVTGAGGLPPVWPIPRQYSARPHARRLDSPWAGPVWSCTICRGNRRSAGAHASHAPGLDRDQLAQRAAGRDRGLWRCVACAPRFANRDCRAGYGDGLLRSLPAGSPVLINDSAYPLAGRVRWT